MSCCTTVQPLSFLNNAEKKEKAKEEKNFLKARGEKKNVIARKRHTMLTII